MSVFRNLLMANQDVGLPSWFTESLVCWYDPKKQGLTNEQIIAENAANGYFLLKDHSRNGLDAKMYGFDGTEASGMIDGKLVFDGEGYGISYNQPILTDYHVFTKRKITKSVNNYILSKQKTESSGAFGFEVPAHSSTGSFGAYSYIQIPKNNISIQSKYYYNNVNIKTGQRKDSDELYIGTNRPNFGSSYWVGDICQIIIFNRTLTSEQIQWVKENIMGEPKPPKQDYIQDGLAFHLDCRDAKPSADGNNWQWVDRIGKIPFDMTAVLQQADKGLVFDGVNSYGSSLDIYPINRLEENTIEVCFTRGNSENFIIYTPSKRENNIKQIGIGFYGDIVIGSFPRNGTSYTIIKKNKNTLSYNIERCYNNKIQILKTRDNYYDFYGKNILIGKNGNNRYQFDGKLYSIRIYNRLLTEEEMLHNQQVDIDTFFGGVLPQ